MDNKLAETKQNALSLIDVMLSQGILTPQELSYYTKPIEETPYDPEFVRQDLTQWYRNLGLESIIDRKLILSPCPFTCEEIEEAHRNQEIILCVPREVNRRQLGALFRLDTWAIYDPLVTAATEKEDFWFKTSMSLRPNYMNKAGLEIKQSFEAEGKIHFSLERYMVFIGRVRYLTQQTPDSQYWIWLPQRPYDRSGMLIAGFDRNGCFSLHGWMPQFSASFLGARYGLAPKLAL